ncbi:MAG: hypothetical protein ACW98F_11380 [Candidatus Hodarchaeales archaeon]|jgi:hypothetical protein
MDYLIIVERQLKYAKNIILGRKEKFQESFENSLFEGEQTAAEVYIHGLTPLYKSCMKILNPEIAESALKLERKSELSLTDQYIDLYEQILKILREIEEKMKEEDLKGHIAYPFNPETTISRLEWIGLNVMHAVTHVGQALRLQSLYLRNKME